ncbi:MAG: Wax ester synthase/acyl-CoA:diacylglycerol acyltransferase [Frankiales bacterium]|jgi:diacylglycerol O-acyltransferase|nr:Wax ester synthase/acyl-CoA:diacylglycerol acyltransferase [Frankiales bacterium]
MALMPVTDQMFILPETREQPMHVGGLQVFDLPPGAGPDFLADLYRHVLTTEDIAPAFRRRAHRGPFTLGQWTWVDDPRLDLEHHVRHSALPRPGRVRELFALVSRLHGTLLDRHRPLWETHLIEGLEGDRFAVYTKLHHATMDGVSALRLLERSLSTDPEERGVAAPFAARPREERARRPGPGVGALPGAVLKVTTDALGLGPRMLKIAESALRDQAVALPASAPKTLLNGNITGSRRFAGDAWAMDRIRGVAKAAEATVNDVVLAMCASALRDYLLERDALPSAPLIAMTPVNLRQDEQEDGGNAVGTILCSLATNVADPHARMLAVKASMDAGKAGLAGLSQLQITALSALVMSPLLVNTLFGVHRLTPAPYNLVISNVPGPKEPLYWNGARLEGTYPLSIPSIGQALNITVTSYAGHMQFGLTGDRRSVPSLQRLLPALEKGLADLETAFGVRT